MASPRPLRRVVGIYLSILSILSRKDGYRTYSCLAPLSSLKRWRSTGFEGRENSSLRFPKKLDVVGRHRYDATRIGRTRRVLEVPDVEQGERKNMRVTPRKITEKSAAPTYPKTAIDPDYSRWIYSIRVRRVFSPSSIQIRRRCPTFA